MVWVPLTNDQFSYVNYQSTINALHTVVDIAINNINNSMLTGIVAGPKK